MNKTLLILSLMLLASRLSSAQDTPQQVTIYHSVESGNISQQQAVETILAHNMVNRGATALYTAGQSITLQPGFIAQAGSVFKAWIGVVNSVNPDVAGLSLRAYPNPFVEQTTIEFVLPHGGRVEHALLNMTGQLIRQQKDETEQSSGMHQSQLNGSDLPAGTYLYRIQVGKESRTIQLLKKP